MSLALAQPKLLQDMKSLYKNRELDEDKWVESFCTILEEYISSAEVQTTVTGAAPSGSVTGTGEGKLL